jgi:hypothetical protein
MTDTNPYQAPADPLERPRHRRLKITLAVFSILVLAPLGAAVTFVGTCTIAYAAGQDNIDLINDNLTTVFIFGLPAIVFLVIVGGTIAWLVQERRRARARDSDKGFLRRKTGGSCA